MTCIVFVSTRSPDTDAITAVIGVPVLVVNFDGWTDNMHATVHSSLDEIDAGISYALNIVNDPEEG